MHDSQLTQAAAHPDLEVFRLRFGKALDFDYYEDWQGSLFSRADPRNGGPALDIERALNKLEKVALRYALKNGRPLVMAFNSEFGFISIEVGLTTGRYTSFPQHTRGTWDFASAAATSRSLG